MYRTILLSALVLLLAVGCGPAAGAQASFLPTPYLPTLAPTPQGLAAPTPLPPPTATPAPTQAPTEAPTSAPGTSSPTESDTPTNTPTVIPQSIGVTVTDSQVTPGQITLTAGRFVRLMVQNLGTVDCDLVVQNLKADNVTPDESMAGKLSREQMDKVSNDAGNGAIHLIAVPQGTAFVTFTPNDKGTFPFTVTISGHQLSGSIVVQ